MKDGPSSAAGRAARYEELERTWARSWMNFSGKSLTIIIPRDEGPNASVRVSNETVPVVRSAVLCDYLGMGISSDHSRDLSS